MQEQHHQALTLPSRPRFLGAGLEGSALTRGHEHLAASDANSSVSPTSTETKTRVLKMGIRGKRKRQGAAKS